jgi:CheY-like chemotaxis protein
MRILRERSTMTKVGAVVPTRRHPASTGIRRLVLIGGEGEESEADPAVRRSRAERPLRSVSTDGRPRGERRLKVLLADDEPSMRLLCRINLDLAGVDVAEAENGADALEKLRDASYDLILLDVMMPDLSGHEVAEQLQSDVRTRDLPIVFLSARASPADLRRGFELGALDYITKPFDPIALATRVEQVLDRIETGEAEAFRREQLDKLGQG